MGKPDRKGKDKPASMVTGKYRIWPGVTCITLVGAAVFVLIYLAAYRVGIVPMPELLAGLLAHEGEKTTVSVPSENADLSLTPPAKTDVSRFQPEKEDADAVFASLEPPEKYHHRFRIRRTTAEGETDISCSLYVDGQRWLLQFADTAYIGNTSEQKTETLYLCDGVRLYRNRPVPTMSNVGEFTPVTVLGLPTLALLRENGAVPSIQEENKALSLHLEKEDGLIWKARAALDTGLFMDLELSKDGSTVLTMYTELFDLAPRVMEETDFWTIPTDAASLE